MSLLRRYLASRHPDGGMVGMDESDFADMVEQSPVKTYCDRISRAFGGRPPGRLGRRLPHRPAGDGLSMIYSFFEPDSEGRRGLGTYIILDHILRAARAALPYVYLGYWVDSSPRMAYKARFRPLERLGPNGWRRFEPEQRELPLIR
jgi:arginine-tRNA-protein transferase